MDHTHDKKKGKKRGKGCVVVRIIICLVVLAGAGVLTFYSRTLSLQGVCVQKVNIASPSGSIIAGQLIMPNRGGVGTCNTTMTTQYPAVALFHGAIASKEVMYSFAQYLATTGMIALAIDHTGFKQSTGVQTPTSRVTDAIAVFDYLSNRTDVISTDISMVGWSAGGRSVLGAGEVRQTRSTVLVGSTPSWYNSSSGGSSAIYPSQQNPGNLLVICGRYDELISAPSLQLALGEVLDRNNATPAAIDTLYGDFASNTAAELVLTPSNHMFEVTDPYLIHRTAVWIHNATGTTPHFDANTPNIVLNEFVYFFAGIFWVFVMMLPLCMCDGRQHLSRWAEKEGEEVKEEDLPELPSIMDGVPGLAREREAMLRRDKVERRRREKRKGRCERATYPIIHSLFIVIAVGGGFGVSLVYSGFLAFGTILLGWFLLAALLYGLWSMRAFIVTKSHLHLRGGMCRLNQIASSCSSIGNMIGCALIPSIIVMGATQVLFLYVVPIQFSFGILGVFEPLLGTFSSQDMLTMLRRFIVLAVFWFAGSLFLAFDLSSLDPFLRIQSTKTITGIAPHAHAPLGQAHAELGKGSIGLNDEGGHHKVVKTKTNYCSMLTLAFLARTWIFLLVLVVQYIFILVLQMRVLGPFSFQSLLLIPYCGYSLLLALVYTIAVANGHSTLTVSVLMAGLIAQLPASHLDFLPF
mmetsp:Transcript_4044/g.7840  ORF Transcript_4044/g.7840 Transcript_4044/m.7840 type:complete len:692 (-) Transcript_4044:188-2263(-)